MEITFRINPTKLNKKGKSVIMADITFQGHRLRISTGEQVNPDNWRPEKTKPVNTKEPGAIKINANLSRFRVKVEDTYDLLRRERKPTAEGLRDLLAPRKAKPKKEQEPVRDPVSNPISIFDYHLKWQAKYKVKYSPEYLRCYKQVEPHLRDYLIYIGVKPDTFTPSDVDEDFLEAYYGYLVTKTDLVNNTISRHAKYFRVMLKLARLPYDWIENDFYESPEGNDLHWPELMAVYNKEYLDERYRHAADLFVFMCMTGLRYKDMYLLRPHHAKQIVVPGRGLVTILPNYIQDKVSAPVTVVFNSIAQEIWDKYEGIFSVPTNQEINRLLKFVGRAARLNRMVKKSSRKGRDRKEKELPLYKVISCHLARHTAASLILEGSGSMDLSQEALGQASASNTVIYAKPKQVQIAEQTLAAWDRFR